MIYEVVVDISNSDVDKVFDYFSITEIELGSRVTVPFGPRFLEGFVIGKKETSDREVKEISAVLDSFPPINTEMLALARHMKDNLNIRLIDALRLFIPSKMRGNKVKTLKKGYIILDADYEIAIGTVRKGAEKQAALLERLKSGGEYESVLNKEFGTAVKVLLEKGVLKREEEEIRRIPMKNLERETKTVTLTAAQVEAKEKILAKCGITLIHGVTGSGKTEIYLAVIEGVLKENKTAIMLVPEISLTPQMLAVFRNRFGDKVGILHSGLSDGERYDEWLRLRRGDATVALGARSAIFAPLENIGAIIIDEEHDNSYTSESNPRFRTHEIASFRAAYNHARLVLGSATPSLGTYKSAIDGDIGLVTLTSRVNKRNLPEMELIDMRKEIRAGNASMFSRQLLSELSQVLSEGNQAMIYINRRGYSSFLRCKACGYVPMCTECEVSLTFHKEDGQLKCHYCGKRFKKFDRCPECGNYHISHGRMGTETVIEELAKIFPNVKTLRLDLDTTSSKDSAAEILSAFSRKEAQILVGTQMIVKGHDFKDVTLVGVMDADLSLYSADYKSNELTFQQITQVAGRAGRESKEGKVIVQTYNPNHYVFRFARSYDYVGFFEKECEVRAATKFPPYSTIARILVKSTDEQNALTATRTCYNNISELKKEGRGVFRVQAMRAPITRIGGEFRFQVVAWIEGQTAEILPQIYKIAAEFSKKDVVSFVEINPNSMR